ncbi:MAG: hypothetical protein ACO2ZM_08795 [Francisellaceae bacterium]
MTSSQKKPLFNCLHANVVARDDIGILILGCAGSGKSYLSYLLIKNKDFSLVADDLVICSYQQGGIMARLPNAEFAGKLYLDGQLIENLSYKESQLLTHVINLDQNYTEAAFFELYGFQLPMMAVDFWLINKQHQYGCHRA